MANRRVDIGKQTQVARLPGAEAPAPETDLGARRPAAERVIHLPVTQIFPDPDQPRAPLLPEDVRVRFLRGEIDCFQAGAAWLAAAKADAGHARRVQFLLDMAAGFQAESGGQINPITGVWTEERGVALIETGEQRYWATVLGWLSAGGKGDPPDVRVIIRDELSRVRQVLENRHVGPPSAVSQAREIATLILAQDILRAPDDILAVHPAERDPYALHRWVAIQRMPRDSWPTLEPVMGMGARQMRNYLQILMLPTALLQLADRFDVPERVLREILQHPEEHWTALLESAVYEGWSSEQAAEAVPDPSVPAAAPKSARRMQDAYQQAYRAVSGFVRTLGRTTEDPRGVIGRVADELATQDDAAASYTHLAELTEQVRLRLLERGLLDK